MPASQPLIIAGAGGHGRGILEIVRAMFASGDDRWQPVGFLDDDPNLRGAERGGLPVRGTLGDSDRFVKEGTAFLLGFGDPALRRRVAGPLARAGAVFAQAIHPSAVLYGDVEIGSGTVIAAGVVVAAGARLGPHALLNLNCTIGHDCILGPYATV